MKRRQPPQTDAELIEELPPRRIATMKRTRTTPRPVSMFAQSAQDLPLFSGTPMRGTESVYKPTPIAKQTSFYMCVVCYDTKQFNGKPCPTCR